MTTPANQPPVGAPPVAGGEGGGSGGGGPNDPPVDPKPGDTVSYASYARLLDEKKAATAERDRLKAEATERERADAEKSGDWQKLVQLEREKNEALARERDELKGKVSTIETQHTQVRKLAAIVKASGGSVDSKWHDLLADKFMPDVVVNPETGEIDQASVTKAVDKLRAQYPEVIQRRVPGTSNADPAAAAQGSSVIKRSEWRKLHSTQMKKWRPDQIIDD